MSKKIIRETLKKSVTKRLLFNKNRKDFHLYYVNIHPKTITHVSFLPESSTFIGKNAEFGVCGGLWDLFKGSFENNFMFETVACILNGRGFQSSPLFKKTKKGRLSEDEAFVQYNKLKGHIEKLKSSGYKSQYELNNLDDMKNIGDFRVPRNEMVIGMGRNGELIRLADGRHRLAIAQQIGIKSIPAILSLIHIRATDINLLPGKRRIITGSTNDFRPF